MTKYHECSTVIARSEASSSIMVACSTRDQVRGPLMITRRRRPRSSKLEALSLPAATALAATALLHLCTGSPSIFIVAWSSGASHLKKQRGPLRALDMASSSGGVECQRCRKWLSPSGFHRSKSGTNGLQKWCKECKKHYMRELYQRRKIANANRAHGSDAKFRCPSCQQLLPSASFAVDLMQSNGLTSWCKACSRKAQKERRKKYILMNDHGNITTSFMQPEDWELQAALAFNMTAEVNKALSRFGMKWCASCMQAKTNSDFYRSRNQRWGLSGYCRKCVSKYIHKTKGVSHVRHEPPSRLN